MHLAEIGGVLIAQKDSFLAAAKGVSIGIAFQKKLGVGLFGGEGFIMQRLEGDGWAFVHAGGTLSERTLAPGEIVRVDTGCIVALQPSVNYDIQYVGKIKTALFGGEGLFFATLTGPGKIWLQSLPLSRLANRIVSAVPGVTRGGREEGSLLGGLGGLLDGDNEPTGNDRERSRTIGERSGAGTNGGRWRRLRIRQADRGRRRIAAGIRRPSHDSRSWPRSPGRRRPRCASGGS